MIQVALFDQAGGPLLADLSPFLTRGHIHCNSHGFARLTGIYQRPTVLAHYLADRAYLPHVAAYDNGAVLWEGRLEDKAVTSDGLRIGAYGYWRALSDAPYTALWSSTKYSDWFVGDDRMYAPNTPDRYQMDKNNRLYSTPIKNSTLGNTGSLKFSSWMYALPHSSATSIVAASFNYDFLAPANWRTLLQTFSAVPYPVGSGVWTPLATVWSLTGTGALQSGASGLLTFSAAVGLNFGLDYNAADAVYGGETGANYLKITNLRVQAFTSATLYADAVARALVANVNALNPSQLSAVTGWIDSPTLDLSDEAYEDQWPSDLLDRLAALGDNQTPPRQWEVGVWDNQTLRFMPRGSQGRNWYIDITEEDFEQSIESLRNSAYAVYQDASGRALRTANSDDAYNIARQGVMRRAAVRANTTSATQAGILRDAAVADKQDPTPRVRFRFDKLYDANGYRYPAWMCRPLDTITVRNISQTLGSVADKLTTLLVNETDYDLDADVMTAVPEAPPPTLDVLIGRGQKKGAVNEREATDF